MRLGDIIFAPASAPGQGGHAVVRVSGPGCLDLLRAIELRCAAPGAAARRAAFTLLTLGGAQLPARVMTFVGPRSFTGEDAFELLVPGGPVTSRRVTEMLRASHGVREALPGEFSARAFLNGRLSAEDAERLPEVIGARTRAAVDAARRGARLDHLRLWMDRLAHLLALVESGIDFVDQEDVQPIAPAELRAALGELRGQMCEFLGRGAGEAGRTDPVVVLAGRPSAGKSSLFNALLESSPGAGGRGMSPPVRAVTHELPGTTRDALREPLDLGEGRRVLLVDTPGLEEDAEVRGASAAEAQGAARAAATGADLVAWCDPMCQDPETALAQELATSCRPIPLIRVRSKIDRPGTTQDGWLPVCAIDGRGLGDLRETIAAQLAIHPAESLDRPSARQMHSIREAEADLTEGLRAAAAESRPAQSLRPFPAEVVAEHLRSALRGLGEISRPVGVEEILGRIFARSCIGK